MKRILITGGAGFIGGHLGRYLADSGLAVDILDNFSRGVEDTFLRQLAGYGQVRLFSRNLTAANAMDDLPDDYHVIYHLAAMVGVRQVTSHPFQVLTQNVAMLESAIAMARRQRRLHRLVFSSTSEVYAGALDHLQAVVPTPESTPLALTDLTHPRTSYLLSKIYGEAMCHHAGVPFTVVRPHNVYGPRMGMSHVIPELLLRAVQAPEGGVLEVFSPSHQRTFCHVEDAVRLLVAVVEADRGEGLVLNLGSPAPEMTMRDLAERVVQTVGRSLTVVAGPVTPGSPPRRCPDLTLTFSLTDYRPAVSLEEGLMRTFQWYRQEVFSGSGLSAI